MHRAIRGLGGAMLDFALPPRCAGCADIIGDVDGFCTDCWSQIIWLGNSGCDRCGLPLEGTEAELCGRCLADPPPLERMRAVLCKRDDRAERRRLREPAAIAEATIGAQPLGRMLL